MKNVPKLRFSGFSNEWEEKKLGDFLEFYATNSLSRDCLNYESGKIRNIHYGDIHMKFPTIVDAKKEIIPFINEDIDTSKIKEESYCKDGDLIIADASEDYNDIGKAIEIENIDNDKVLAGLHTILARDTKGVTAKRFKGYLLLNEAVRKQIKILAAGAKVLGISKTNLVKVSVKLPSKEEQEKIANFLTKVDTLIEKQDEKVSNLEKYKKGMMQKIFSQEIRFKKDDGGEYPEWEEKEFSQFLTSRVEKQVPSEEAPLMAFTATGGVEAKGERYDRSFLVKNDEKLYKRTELNDFIYSSNNLDVGSIGLNRYGTAVISDVYEIFIISKDSSSNFISELIQTPSVMNKIIRYRQGVMYGQYRIHSDDFLKVKEFIPCLEEQVKIDNFLYKIDSIVEKEKEKLEELRLWKKGLLQQMFV